MRRDGDDGPLVGVGQGSVPVKVSISLSCVVIVMGVRAEAAPAAANVKAAANASAQSTIFLRCKARSMRLSFPFVCSLCAQSTIREEVSQGHGGTPPFRSGNCVGASPYEAAYFGYFQERPTSQLRRTPFSRTSENNPSTHSGE